MSEICDFGYTIDNGQEREDVLTNYFSLDKGVGQTDNTSTSTTGHIMTLGTSTNFAQTYCGSNDDDKDGDGVKDNVDKCPNVFNPKQEDDDADGIGNVCDNCLIISNHDQLDADQDGVGDVCDICKNNANFDQADTDVDENGAPKPDGIGDVCDNCRTIYNPNQEDVNKNGIGDVCEGLAQGAGTNSFATTPLTAYRFVGDKQYELSNHLGNVLSVISDRRLFANNLFVADIQSYSDYYPFGMLVPSRHGSSDSYRYGFQGQEKDDELKGEGNSLNYTFRMHDPRIGRFFATDPLESKYAYYSPYQFSGNRVIDMVELEGLEPAQAPKAEGERANAVDQNAINNNTYGLSDLIGWLRGNTENNALYKTWVGHSVTGTDAPQWVEEANYKQIVLPIAIEFAKNAGWSYGDTWKSAKDLICNPGSDTGLISPQAWDFISSRVTAADLRDYLTQIGASAINSANKSSASSATGAITPQEIDSPFFGLTFGLKAFAMRGEATGGATLGFSTSNNYKKTFFTAYPELEGQVVVHHAVEQQVLTRYNIFSKSEIHSLENLRDRKSVV